MKITIGNAHPIYRDQAEIWRRYELTARGGREFINVFLKRFSNRENIIDFEKRRDVSYCAGIAKKSVRRVINSIVQRMPDVSRIGGPRSYQQAIEENTIDFQGNSMNSFMARFVIPDLLNIGKIGVFVDKLPLSEGLNRAESAEIHPYLYAYSALNILSWDFDPQRKLRNLLLRDHVFNRDEETGLVKSSAVEYRFLQLTDNGVKVSKFNRKGDDLNKTVLLKLTQIPFVIFELSMSLLADVADYQIAATNLASSDINFGLTSNMPFYTEQISAQEQGNIIRGAGADTPVRPDTRGSSAAPSSQIGDPTIHQPGTANYAAQARAKQIRVGSAHGRSYAQGMDRPGFIHPSTEPLLASMKKQAAMAEEVDRLVEQTLTNVESKRVRQTGGQKPSSGLEAGLSNIGVELEFGERNIAAIWALYEDDNKEFTIDYPEQYSLRSDQDIRDEITELRKSLPMIPSLTYQKAVAQRIVHLELRGHIARTVLMDITAEIDEAVVVANDPDVIRKDHEDGLISDKLASEARLYPKDEYKRAREDRAIRVKLTLEAQTKAVSGVSETQSDLKPPPSRGPQDRKVEEDK